MADASKSKTAPTAEQAAEQQTTDAVQVTAQSNDQVAAQKIEAKPIEIKPAKGSIEVTVVEVSSNCPISHASINLFNLDSTEEAQSELEDAKWPPPRAYKTGVTDSQGKLVFTGLPSGKYQVQYAHLPKTDAKKVSVSNSRRSQVKFEIDFAVCIESMLLDRRGKPKVGLPTVGETLQLKPHYNFDEHVSNQVVSNLAMQPGVAGFPYSFPLKTAGEYVVEFQFSIPLMRKGKASRSSSAGQGTVTSLSDKGQDAKFSVITKGNIMAISSRDPVSVTMSRTETLGTSDLALWTAIKNSCENLSFDKYSSFIDTLISGSSREGSSPGRLKSVVDRATEDIEIRSIPFTNGEAYRLLKAATEAFVLVNCGVSPGNDTDVEKLMESLNNYNEMRDLPPVFDTTTAGLDKRWAIPFTQYLTPSSENESEEGGMLPYLSIIRRKMPELELVSNAREGFDKHLNYQLLQEKMSYPFMLELIWSYWHEEGMQVQTMNAITRRFQNVRSPSGNDPLANLETDPLRPLNNLLWGYTQDEQNRLTVVRRNYEYDHHYGLRLEGKAVQNFRPADSRSKFLEAFHHLLRMCSMFYKQDDDTTVKADAFPVLNALKEVHLILSQGAHNQYGDLPSTARVEMLMQQWMLARPEFREFLPTRMMVAYPEPWMDRVDAMKKLQGWSDTSVLHFRSLGMFGEQVLLSVRFGAWSDIYEPAQAFNWARFWRPQVQGYIHAYRAVTGVDLTGTAVDAVVDATMPSVLLQRRLDQQQRSA